MISEILCHTALFVIPAKAGNPLFSPELPLKRDPRFRGEDELGNRGPMYLATLMLLGSGELGREFAIAAKRLGCRVIACDRYDNAPAMQLADEREVFPMLDGAALRAAVEKHRPDYIVPEIEAIDTATLGELEAEGWKVVPSALAVQLTMNRDGIRDFAARELGLTTS